MRLTVRKIRYTTVQTRNSYKFTAPTPTISLWDGLTLFSLSLFSSFFLLPSVANLSFSFQSLLPPYFRSPHWPLHFTEKKKLLIVSCECKIYLCSQLFSSPSLLSKSTSWSSSCSRQTLLQILNSISSYCFRNPVSKNSLYWLLSVSYKCAQVSDTFQKQITKILNLPSFHLNYHGHHSYSCFFKNHCMSKVLCSFTSNRSSTHRRLASVSNTLLKLLLSWSLMTN